MGSSYVNCSTNVMDYTLCSWWVYLLMPLFVSTVYFQFISSYVNIQKKSGTTPYVVTGCVFWRRYLCQMFLSNSHKVTYSSYADSTIYVQSCLRLHPMLPQGVLFGETVRMGSFVCQRLVPTQKYNIITKMPKTTPHVVLPRLCFLLDWTT